jgi:hypothetical protein
MLHYGDCVKAGRLFGVRRWAAATGVEQVNLMLSGAFRNVRGIPNTTQETMRGVWTKEEAVFPRMGDVVQILMQSEDELDRC